jgi:putative aminopeptidase FrvX
MKLDYVKNIMVKLLNIPSPTGMTEDVANALKIELESMKIDYYVTRKGAIIATIEGAETKKQKSLSAHIDTLGAMVKEIKSNGRLKLTQIGGYPWNSIEGAYVNIHSNNGNIFTGTVLLNKASSHVFGDQVGKSERNDQTLEVRIDEKVKNKDDVLELGIGVGDFVSIEPKAFITDSGFIKSRHLDDKACVASLLGVLKKIKDDNIKIPYTTNFIFSNYEEVGHGLSSSLPTNTYELVAIDMAAPGEGQTSDEQKVTICAKDSSGPFDLKLRKHLENLAASKDIPYVVDIYPYYGSDAAAALRSGSEIRHGLIGPGVDASHSFERTHEDGVNATTMLAFEYVMSTIVE